MQIGDPIQLKSDSNTTFTVAEIATDGSVRAIWLSTDKQLQSAWLPVGTFQAA